MYSWQSLLLRSFASPLKSRQCRRSTNFAAAAPPTTSPQLQELCGLVSTAIGGLGDLESRLDTFKPSLAPWIVTQVIDRCKNQAPARNLLRFFLWSHKNLKTDLPDEDYNRAIRAFAGLKDHTAMEILISDLKKDGRAMEARTYSVLAERLVKLGREDEAVGLFKNLEKYKCPQDSSTVVAIVNALCSRGHAKRAETVVRHHHKEIKISGVSRSLVYGWCVQGNDKEARRVMKDMKSSGGVTPDLFCYNAFLRCLCERNLKRNPSGLVPDALDVMMEMRSHNVAPNSISYNVLLSCLGRTGRVRESCQILERMKITTGCSPDWMSYYLVIRVLYSSARFGKGNQLFDEMIGKGLVPSHKFFHDLIRVLCGAGRPYYAVELFEKMKRISDAGGNGPVYDVLIPKLCIGGDLEKGKELWDEAANMGVELRCSIAFVIKANRKYKISGGDTEDLVFTRSKDNNMKKIGSYKNLKKPLKKTSNIKKKKKKKK